MHWIVFLCQGLLGFTVCVKGAAVDIDQIDSVGTSNSFLEAAPAAPSQETSTAQDPNSALVSCEPLNCTSISLQPGKENFTNPYCCALSANYSILGLYYNTCNLTTDPDVNSVRSLDVKIKRDQQCTSAYCCDASYSSPMSFDTVCIVPSDDDGQSNNTGSSQASEPAQPACFISPILRPKAQCVKLQ